MTVQATPYVAYPRPDVAEKLRLPPGRLRILDAAAEAFMERGYDSTSIDEIADRIGATKGAVYYNYRSKLDIFLAVYERGMLLLEERTADALQKCADATSAERLRAVSVAHADNIMSNYTYHVVIQSGVEQRRQMALKDADRTRLSELDQMRTHHESLIQAFIDEGQRDGSIRDMPARLATRTLIGGIVGIAIWYRPRTGQTQDERLDMAGEVVELLLTGLLPR
ncbi:TetR/AcrR family transcriptional regulator [Streptomyces tauricus]|uniref:TetR/AcrR family transcriptional regulator n=1 Tax=Streptomyces tauricus TaxID=68274 RepID=A0ABZ1JSL4_9ACTN|nr:TetR/AcrR family transcriptional regulator [Streptomyces tauricus]